MRTTPIPAIDPGLDLHEHDIAAREARWWHLRPGEPGYDQPLHAYLGFTEQQWHQRRWEGVGDYG